MTASFNIEKPLWVFVGNTVSGEESDILIVVNFLADFLNSDRRTDQALAGRPDFRPGADSRCQGPQQFRRTLYAVVGRHIITNSSADFLCVWVWLANSQPALRASRPYVLDTAQQTLQYSLLTMKSIPHQPLPQ